MPRYVTLAVAVMVLLAFPSSPSAVLQQEEGESAPRLLLQTGGSGSDVLRAAIRDASRRLLLIGETSSPDWPSGTDPAGGTDLFILRLNPDLDAPEAVFRLGGRSSDRVVRALLTPAGDLLVAGVTDSPDFPAGDAVRRHGPGGGRDLFLLLLDDDRMSLKAGVRLGGGQDDQPFGLLQTAGGAIYVGGTTRSADYPVTDGVFDMNFSSGRFDSDYHGNLFVSCFSPDLAELEASTFLGGTGGEIGGDLAPGPDGSVYVAGSTRSLDFPVTSGVWDTGFNSDPASIAGDVVVARLAPRLDAIIAATYVGGSGIDWAYRIAADPAGGVVLTGHVGRGWPVTAGAVQGECADTGRGFASDAYLTRLDSDLTRVTASTLLGGPGEDIGEFVLPDGQGGFWVTGVTRSAGFPTTPGTLQERFAPGQEAYTGDYFISRLDAHMSILERSTLLGSRGNENPFCLLIPETEGSVLVAGTTGSPDLAGRFGTAAPVGARLAGQRDIFLVRLDRDLSAAPGR